MEKLVKIQQYLKHLNKTRNAYFPKFELFSDGSCGVSDHFMKTYLEARSIKKFIELLEKEVNSNLNESDIPF